MKLYNKLYTPYGQDLAHDINTARARRDRAAWCRRTLAWLGLGIALILAGIGIGALTTMPPHVPAATLLLFGCWFGWSLHALTHR
jgi:fatty acid desaturase